MVDVVPPELRLDFKKRGGDAEIPAPHIQILLLTYLRTTMAVRTVQGIVTNLDYPKELLSWYVADDGSPPQHMDAIFKTIEAGGHKIDGYHNIKSIPGTPFCGRGWNTGLRYSYRLTDFVLVMEDDWVLEAPLDIRPYVRVLLERQDVGMMRLSCLAKDNDLRVVTYEGDFYFKYLRTANYAYSGNPHIRHARFTNYYGYFAEDRSPGDIELDYDSRFRQLPGGPDIWRPADFKVWGNFGHIGNERTW